MTSIKEEAVNYVAPSTKNIADLEAVSVDMSIYAKTFKEGTDDEFTINVLTVNGEDYRVPDTVLKQLKANLKAKPKLKTFKVDKEGTGLKTSYTIVQLE